MPPIKLGSFLALSPGTMNVNLTSNLPRKDVLAKPRYATAVLSPETFDGYGEADLVRDLLFVFQGISTNAIRFVMYTILRFLILFFFISYLF